MKRLLLVTVLGLGLAGCGPIYQTRQEFVPPTTPEGKIALNDCLHHRDECNQSCQKIQVECEQNEAIRSIGTEVAQALSKDHSDKGERHQKGGHRGQNKHQPQHYSVCQQRLDQCTEGCNNTYNQCFQNVGGVINTYQECVFNCSKIPH